MKRILILTLCVAALAISCKKSETKQNILVKAVATAKSTSPDGQFFLQVNDSLAVIPTNQTTNPFGRQVRVCTYYYDKGSIDTPVGSATKYWRSCELALIDSIRTKPAVASAEGNASVEIYKSWVNSIEDGYITLFFEGLWGTSGIVHEINLQKNFVADSLCFIVKHNDKGDVNPIIRNQFLMAFDISDMEKPVGKSEFDVFIRYESYSGRQKRIKFHYKNGIYTGPFSDHGNELEIAGETQNTTGKID